MKRKYVKRDYSKLKPMDVYNIVRSGELKKFPNHYLNKEVIKEIVRYVFLEELNYTREDLLEIDHNYLSKLCMGGFRKFFDIKNSKMIQYCFPEYNIKTWEFRKVEAHFWSNNEVQREFLLWISEKENLNPKIKEDISKINARLIIEYGGSALLKAEPDLYTIISVINEAGFKEWEIMKVGSWSEEKVIEAVKWLVEEKLKYSLEQACTLKISDFKKYDLDGMLQKACNHSILYALNLTYGDCFTRKGTRFIVLKEAN